MHLSIILLAFVYGSCALPSQSEPFDQTENSKQNKIKNEYILTYPIESGIHLISTPESRYQNRISLLSKTARVVDTAPINDKHDSVLVQELLAEEIEAIQKDGARVFENKIVTALGIQNKAPWHLSV